VWRFVNETLETTMKKLLATALLCSAAATPVLAQSTKSFYGALDYGMLGMSGSGSFSSPGALTLSGGYRYTSTLGAEAGLTLMGDASADLPSGARVNISQSILSVVAVATVPLNREFNAFGKAGLGLHNGEINGLPDDLIFGFGGQYLLDSRTSLRLMYESLGRAKIPSTTAKADLSRLSIGVTYNF
jgi:opacity protein-like surface antigen